MAKYRLTFGAGMWCGGYWNRSTVSGLAGLHRDAATYQARTTASSDQRVVPRLGGMSRRICQFGADSRPARPRATASRPTVALTWSIRALRRLPRWSGSTRGAWATRHGRQEGACLVPWKASLASVRVTADPPGARGVPHLDRAHPGLLGLAPTSRCAPRIALGPPKTLCPRILSLRRRGVGPRVRGGDATRIRLTRARPQVSARRPLPRFVGPARCA